MPQTSILQKKTNGFTVIELLMVISIIAILSTILFGVVNIPATRARTRDNIRIADLKKIMFALNLYYGDRRQYPSIAPATTPILINGTNDVMSGALRGIRAAPDNVAFITTVPTDPLNPTNNSLCDGVAGGYFYFTSAARDFAVLATEMERADNVGSDTCASVSASLCTTPTAVCYAIRSN